MKDHRVTAWVKFLAKVSDRELIRYITSWEQALTWYEIKTYSHNSNARALAGAYEVLDIRARKREKNART
jgi:hypothetical protein